jgi:glycosyltransferase involved in cell wall biosynthesis
MRPGLARLTPRSLPGKTRTGIVHLTDAAVRLQLRLACYRLGGDVRGVLSVASRPGFGSCRERRRVFWVRDDFAEGATLMALSRRRVERQERRMAASADVLAAVSPPLVDKWRKLGRDAVLVTNGCDARGLASVDEAPPPSDLDLPGPVLGVVGTIGDRIDFGLLERLAERGHSMLLVGARQKSFPPERLAGLLSHPNVAWVGPKPYAELPSYLRVIDVGLVPYQDSAFNRASFPLKTLEYLAAGRAAISTDLPASRWLGTELISIARDTDDFCSMAEAALAERRTMAVTAARRAFAARHDWTHKAQALLSLLK